MILDWGKDNAVIPMTLDGWVWGVFGSVGIAPTTGHGPQAGGKVVPFNLAQTLLYQEMAEGVVENMRKSESYRKERQRKGKIESYRMISEQFGKIRQSAAFAVILAEI